MSAIILHHYDASPYANKIRKVLGYKGLPWQSVIIPEIMPKPDLAHKFLAFQSLLYAPMQGAVRR